MSRRVLRQTGATAGGRPSEMAEPAGEGWTRSRRDSPLFRVVLSLLLVAVSFLAAAVPVGPLDRVRAALIWTVTFDSDFRDMAQKVQRWAEGRGGWIPALAGLWRTGQARVRAWLPQLQTNPTEEAARVDPPLRSGPVLQWPVQGVVLYGYGWLPPEVGEHFHEGLDVLAPVGTPVVAAAPGTVTRVAMDPLLGMVVEVDHGSIIARYAQVSKVRVRVGEQVTTGQLLAVVGQPTGAERDMEPHLHFEVRPAGGGEPVDPAHYLGLGGSQL